MNVVYIVFDDDLECHLQAHFSILSFLRIHNPEISINVITNRPDFYSQLKNQINIIEINDQTLKAWRGESNFIYRIKIKGLERIDQIYPGQPLLYVDSDTFLYGDLSELSQQARRGVAYMHAKEGALSSLNTTTERRMWKRIRHRTYSSITINETHAMWNAGVILLPGQNNSEVISQALQLCDEIYRDAPIRLVEQFSFSVLINESYDLQEASPWICHYWTNKPGWNAAIQNFFLNAYLKKLSFQDQLDRIRMFDFASVPFSVKRSSTYNRVVKLASRLFPYRSQHYLR